MKVLLLTCSIFVALWSAPVVVNANTVPSRIEVFAALWKQIKRPIEKTSATAYIDVPTSSEHYNLLRYAKRRGILDDVEQFYPDSPVLWGDVYRWLMRTRNTHDVDELTAENYRNQFTDFPLFTRYDESTSPASLEQITNFAKEFDQFLDKQVHESSLYSEKFHGKGIAFGEKFDMHALTAAHPRFPHNTLVRVTNMRDTSRSVVVRINDRGPFVEGRSIDLSLAAFLQIEDRSKGIANVTIERLGDVSLVDPSIVPPAPSVTATQGQSTCPILSKRFQQRVSSNMALLQGVPHVLPFGNTLTLTSTDFFAVHSIKLGSSIVVAPKHFISPNEEQFTFTPQEIGKYSITIRTATMQKRTFTMQVQDCRMTE